ncbi:MAG: putative Ig domain-containing protein [Pirellulales bacterium]|nr:putative Ig domain-containing protein [Pirellulales bacterium]
MKTLALLSLLLAPLSLHAQKSSKLVNRTIAESNSLRTEQAGKLDEPIKLVTKDQNVLKIVLSPDCSSTTAEESWKQPFVPDEHTVALYHFDEGEGNETHDALGDKSLTLRANKRALGGQHEGFGTTAKFERKDDDPNLLIGPVNHDKLHLRSCTYAWTIEAWVKYEGQGGLDTGRTALNICGTDEEGFSLPSGKRGGWSFGLHSKSGVGDLKRGITHFARFMGSPRGKDPNHDTSGILLPYASGGYTDAQPATITDQEWHHVVWQFRYADQTNFFFLDGKLIRKVQLPVKDENRIIENNAVDVGIPFVVGGFQHSQDPPYFLRWGTFEGQIDELRISKVLRYPVAETLSILKQTLPDAGFKVPYRIDLGTDASEGAVTWKLVDGRLPEGLSLNPSRGRIHGTPTENTPSAKFTLEAQDEAGNRDSHQFEIAIAAGELVTESLPPSFVGMPYHADLSTNHLAAPLKWELVHGELPQGLKLSVAAEPIHANETNNNDPSKSKPMDSRATLTGTPTEQGWTEFTIQVTDSNGTVKQCDLVLKVLPQELLQIKVDKHTVALFDWQGPDGKLIPDRMGEKAHTLTWTNIGGDRRVSWPGRELNFPQLTGHGVHGFASEGKGLSKLDFKTCDKAWTLEAWIRRGGPMQAFGGTVRGKQHPFHFGHICGSYDLSKKGVWELYLSDVKSEDWSMAPGIHFFGKEEDQALKDLHPWHRPSGIVGDRSQAGIRDAEWHHVAWQYNYEQDLHELYLDGRLIWKMDRPDGRRLVNNREHDAQFSVSTRLTGYSRYGGAFNYLGEGNFFGQIGEIRISNIRRYGQ